MAFDRNSNAFTFGFAIVMVIVVGAVLSGIALGLKDRQKMNDDVKKKMDILGAINVKSTRANAVAEYDKYIANSYVINYKGAIVEGMDALSVDIKKQFRDRSLAPGDKLYPLYIFAKDGKKFTVVPMVGTGLWGPIWGFVALEDDLTTIYGATFDHKTETPGLGAEIRERMFQEKFYGKNTKRINYSGNIFEICKGGAGCSGDYQVDGITGGTITSKGVEEMMIRTFRIYENHFKTI
jgi:Na+-transporting NADH:ubiquinone oxidoreductase subunit C